MSRIDEGTEAFVTTPVKTFDSQWFIPGEQLFVLEDRGGDSVRVRCGVSGADCWISRDLLTLKESA